jgi:protein-L-isoaspartate(D-aspartate) O-methyltransferase
MKWPFIEGSKEDGERRRRRKMVEQQLRPRGIADEAVLGAMERVPRHAFVPEAYHQMAYTDGPLPIGNGQTISQPYIVAVMSEALRLRPGQRVLEVGTGCGYQAAVLAEMGLLVYTIEYIDELGADARERLTGLGYDTIRFRTGDGRAGWPEEAPFDGIIVTAAPADVPAALVDQLSTGGRLVIPVGRDLQELVVYRKNDDGSCIENRLFPVRFVPLV